MSYFTTIDFETANSDMSSICQVGIVKFGHNEIIETWSSLVNPNDYFDPINVSIHGIRESDVLVAPTFIEISQTLKKHLSNSIVVSHSQFDKVVLNKACDKYGVKIPYSGWIDSALVARRTWSQFAQKGYGLKNLADFIGYSFTHHNALEDAKATGFILLAALNHLNADLATMRLNILKPKKWNIKHYERTSKMDGNPDGEYFGEVLVFTGSLKMPRKEAANHAALIGCNVAVSVTKKTTLLVVGDRDVSMYGGVKKSTKHRKAEELIKNGQSIRIIRESDFMDLIKE